MINIKININIILCNPLAQWKVNLTVQTSLECQNRGPDGGRLSRGFVSLGGGVLDDRRIGKTLEVGGKFIGDSVGTRASDVFPRLSFTPSPRGVPSPKSMSHSEKGGRQPCTPPHEWLTGFGGGTPPVVGSKTEMSFLPSFLPAPPRRGRWLPGCLEGLRVPADEVQEGGDDLGKVEADDVPVEPHPLLGPAPWGQVPDRWVTRSRRSEGSGIGISGTNKGVVLPPL